MKKNHLKLISSFIVSLLVITGCQKQINEPQSPVTTDPQTEESQSRNGHDGDRNECRLVDESSEFGGSTYTYNHKGLLNEWDISDYGLFKQEYNAKGRLVKSRFYSGAVLVNTIIFFYHNDRVVKETWYNGNTQEKTDEVFYSYTRNGLIRKTESIMGDYHTIYKHSPEGNVLEWNFYLGGSLFYTGQNTFRHHHKNPYLAMPGIDYGFPYINAGIYKNKWYPISEKIIYYDEEGNSTVLYDQDPRRTIVNFNQNNFVTASDFFDRESQGYFHFRFNYENCGCDESNKAGSAQKLSPSANHNSKINPLKLLKKGSVKSMKEQVKEFRQQMKSIKNSGVNN